MILKIPILCYSAATAVGISRLTEHEHLESDVFVGALNRLFIGKTGGTKFQKTHPDSPGLLSFPKEKESQRNHISSIRREPDGF